MSTSRFSPRSLARLSALCVTAAVLAILTPFLHDGASAPTADLPNRVAEMRRDLPRNLANGSVLGGIELDGTRLTLNLTVDDRLDLAAIRDGDREEKCAAWRDALRARDLSVIEYRYRQTGATSSLFLDRTVCG